MPTPDGPETGSKRGETLPQATVAYSGPKQGLPTEFGRYRIQKLLGGGGMGAVYLVVNTELEREEALKVPHFDAAADPHVHERFLRETKAAAGLDHPNLCPVYDAGVRDGVYYLTMRYLKGKLLSEHSDTAQPPRKAVECVTKLAQALAAAHAKGVIHRDLKPNNIMMCAGVGPVVMDFGLAKYVGQQDKALTQMGITLGTPAYMPPEQVKGELDRVGPASDIYSLGVILFQLLTGRLPFTGGTAAEMYEKILYTTAPSPSSLRPELPAVLDAICARATAKAPEARYASMKEFAAALIEYLKGASPAEGAGELKAAKMGTAAIFQAATAAPKQAKASPLMRKPSNAPGSSAVAVDESGGGRLRRTISWWVPSVLLMLIGLAAVVTFCWMLFANGPAPNTPPARSPLADLTTNSIGMKLKLIKAGAFKMGSPDSDKAAFSDEKPQHEVEITHPFYLGVYPVTKAQFAAFVDAAGYKTEAERSGAEYNWRAPDFSSKSDQKDDEPVVRVSWNDAVKFCAWLSQKEKKSYELPTEAQWEYACRAGTTTAYSFGDDLQMLGDYAWFQGNSGRHTHPVGSKKPNPWGLYDMHGNVYQWCADFYDEKSSNDGDKDPKTILGISNCVVRGSSWLNNPAHCRSACRNMRPSGFRGHQIGFRVSVRPD